MANEVYFCGKCNAQQQPNAGIKCKSCGKPTVSWFTDRENHAAALKKWKYVNP